MKVVLLSSGGVALSRNVYAELSRRVAERKPTNTVECIAALEAAIAEFDGEITTYAASVKEN